MLTQRTKRSSFGKAERNEMFRAGPIDRPKPKQPKPRRRSCSRPGQVSDLLRSIVLRSTQKVWRGCSFFQSAAVERTCRSVRLDTNGFPETDGSRRRAALVRDGRCALARVLRPRYDAAFRFRIVVGSRMRSVQCPTGTDGRPKAKQPKHRKHSLSRPRPVLTFGFQVCPGLLSVFLPYRSFPEEV